MSERDTVNHPPHYTAHPSGVECIDVVEHMTFNIGNAVKYLWRCGLKGDHLEDLQKARWYIDREIQKRTKSDPKRRKALKGALKASTDHPCFAVVDRGYMGDPQMWCYWDEEYPDEGSVGMFATRAEAVADLARAGYSLRTPDDFEKTSR